MIYLDNAATTLYKPPEVLDAVCAAMRSFGNSGRGVHAGSLSAARTIYAAREAAAALFSCRADHVCFTANSTEALNIAISGLLGPEDHVISTDCEHNSVLRPLYRLRGQGMGLDFLAADRAGNLDYDALESLLRPNTRAVICTHASNLTGNLTDLARVAEFCHAHGLLFLIDASQTAGVFPLDMAALGADVVCFTGHKSLMGPQGTGGLCVREGVNIRPWCVGKAGRTRHIDGDLTGEHRRFFHSGRLFRLCRSCRRFGRLGLGGRFRGRRGSLCTGGKAQAEACRQQQCKHILFHDADFSFLHTMI